MFNLSGPTELVEIGSWHAQDPKFESYRVSFTVESTDGQSEFKISDAYSVPRLNLSKRPIQLDKVIEKWPHLAVVPLSCVSPGEVKLLIGMDHSDPHEVLEYRKYPFRQNAPKAILTAFGWAIQGNIGPAVNENQGLRCCVVSMKAPQDDLLGVVNQFLLHESYGAVPEAKPAVGKDVLHSRKLIQETTRYDAEHRRYETGVLWARDDVVLPNNYQGTLERFKRTQKRLDSNANLASVVHKEMEQNFNLGFAEKLSEEQLKALPKGRVWFLPWPPVAHPHKPGKWRVMFDAAAEFHGMSLNDRLLKGEVPHVNLIDVLLRLREFAVAICGDITKMFHQVRVRKEDAFIYLFLYAPKGESVPVACRMKVHIFGSVCSPAVCAYVLHRAAVEDADAEDAPFAVQEVEIQFYVDNWITSFHTKEEAITGAAKLTRALAKGGFELAQWGSSSRFVLAALPGQSILALNVDLDGLPTERTLGMSLDFAADCFVLKATGNVSRSTHREILRATATNFDPLGFPAPVLITAKMILHKVCKAKLGWDDLLDQELSEEWQQWAGSLTAVNDLQIPRWSCPFPHHEDATDLILFSDASERAFCAVGDLRFELPDGKVKVAFVLVKAKVVPVKYVSMP